MLLDPQSPEGAAWIADHLPDCEGDLEWLFNDHTEVCEICGRRFTEGSDCDDGICWDCYGADDGFDPRENSSHYVRNGSCL
jgi:hypothetical protein